MCIRDRYITISSQGIELETPVLVVKDLIYDVIIGTDTLKNINAIIDFSKNELSCTVNNHQYKIVLGNNDVDKQSEAGYVRITKPVAKVVVNNNKDNMNNTEQLNASQRNKLNQLIKRHTETFQNTHTTTHVYTHDIQVTDENKFVCKTYPIPCLLYTSRCV